MLFYAAVLLSLILIAGAIGTFVLPTELKVQRVVTINKPSSEIFAYVKLIKNQNEWGPWFRKDPAMKQDFRGTDGTPGFVSAWNSTNDEVGEGEQEIIRISEGSRLDTVIRFKRPFETQSDAFLTTETVGQDQTKVTWGFAGTMPRPFNLMCLVVDLDKEVGRDFEQGLSNLKTIMERQ